MSNCSNRVRIALTLLALLVIVALDRSAVAQSTSLPARLQDYLTRDIKLTPAEIAGVSSGKPVTKLLDGDPSKEVSVFGIVWVEAPPEAYVRAVTDIETFERGENFRATKKISDPPRLEDFDQLELPADDVKALRTCKVGDCELKLSQATLDRVRKEIDFTQPDVHERVTRLARQLALDYVTAYLHGGNAELAVYRDSKHPTFVAKEFESMVARIPAMEEFTPDLRRYLLEFPKVTIPNTTSFLYWQEARFGLKPTARINHVVIQPNASGGFNVASKQLYASHYFWTALETRVLAKDPNRPSGFYFVNVNRSRSDGLSGMVGRLIRGKVRGQARSGMESALMATKRLLEGAR
jgi:hypothetical protein